MTSVDDAAKVQADSDPGKATTPPPVSIRFTDARHAKLVRLAAAERDTTRSAFIAEAAVKAAREVLKLQREDDFNRWLDAA
jgi:uncharacterized protein (DUF1778 family)